MELHLANQSLKSTNTTQCFSENPNPQNEKLKIKANKTGTRISEWLLFFLFSLLSFHFICVIWSRCCNHFINSHISQQHFLQHPPLTKSVLLHTDNGVDGIEGEVSLLRTVAFSFWNGLTKLKHRYFIFCTLISHISINTFVWVGGKLLADPRLISWEHSYFKGLQRHRSCQVLVRSSASLTLQTTTLCLKNICIKPKKSMSVLSYRKNCELFHLSFSNAGMWLFSLPWILLLTNNTWQELLTVSFLIKRSWNSPNESP